MIRVFQPTLGKSELAAIAEVFARGWPGAGPLVKEFEEEFARSIGVEPQEMIAVTSCTEGLFQALAALELKGSDEVVLPTISFIGAAHAVRASGARLRLADVDPVTLNLAVDQLQPVLTSRTRAILLLHYGGRMEEIEEIAELAKAKNIVLIEDSACSLGGTNGGIPYGTFGDIAAWSFDAMKLLVTGDGGMVRTADHDLRKKIFDNVNLGGARPGLEGAAGNQRCWWETNPNCWGRRAYMNDLTAAIGLAQLRKIDRFIARRREIVRMYDEALRSTSWIRLSPPPTEESVPYFYWIQTEDRIRNSLANYLRQNDIYVTFRYWPLHRTKLYHDSGPYPGAELASDTTLLLPLHQNLSDEEVIQIVEAIQLFESKR